MTAFTILIAAVLGVAGVAGAILLGVLGVGGIASFGLASNEEAPAGNEWEVVWDGHEIVVRSEGSVHFLYVDGKLIAQGRDGDAITGSIRGTPLQASVQPGNTNVCVVHVDGSRLQVQRRPYGTAFASAGGGAPVASLDVPEDPRWPAIEELVDQVRSQGGEGASLASRSKEELRTLLLQIADAERANAAHEKLGTGTDALGPIIEAHESRVAALVSALQKLHFGTAEEIAARPEEYAKLAAALEVELSQRQRQ